MGRHIHHRCAFKAIDPAETRPADNDGYLRGLTHCGSTSYFMPKERKPGAGLRASCPKCAAAAGKAKLATLGGRVRLEPAPENVARSYKSAWTVLIDGEARGYIVAEAGFGKGWDLMSMPTATDLRGGWRYHGNSATPRRPNLYNADNVPPEQPIQPLHYGARDAMACGALRAYEAGLLPTAAEREAQEAEAQARRQAAELERERQREQDEKERTQRRAEAAERRATARDAMAELAARPDLTNLELAGIAAVLAIIGEEG